MNDYDSRRERLRGDRLFNVTVRVPELGIVERHDRIKGNDEWHVRTNAMFLCQHKLTGQMVEYDVVEVCDTGYEHVAGDDFDTIERNIRRQEL